MMNIIKAWWRLLDRDTVLEGFTSQPPKLLNRLTKKIDFLLFP
jgi:hypothetical protein